MPLKKKLTKRKLNKNKIKQKQKQTQNINIVIDQSKRTNPREPKPKTNNVPNIPLYPIRTQYVSQPVAQPAAININTDKSKISDETKSLIDNFTKSHELAVQQFNNKIDETNNNSITQKLYQLQTDQNNLFNRQNYLAQGVGDFMHNSNTRFNWLGNRIDNTIERINELEGGRQYDSSLVEKEQQLQKKEQLLLDESFVVDEIVQGVSTLFGPSPEKQLRPSTTFDTSNDFTTPIFTPSNQFETSKIVEEPLEKPKESEKREKSKSVAEEEPVLDFNDENEIEEIDVKELPSSSVTVEDVDSAVELYKTLRCPFCDMLKVENNIRKEELHKFSGVQSLDRHIESQHSTTGNYEKVDETFDRTYKKVIKFKKFPKKIIQAELNKLNSIKYQVKPTSKPVVDI